MIAKKNNSFTIGAAIFVVLIIVLSGVYYAFAYFGEEDVKDDKKEDIDTIDDRISPGGNQALLVEINRIRHRGIIDAMLSRGNSWKNPPSYYYTVTRDGNTFVSKEVAAAGGASSEEIINVWDTIFMENRIQEDIEEEQEEVEVIIEIIERTSSGLLGRKHNDVKQEVIELTYDFRTARWSGDDNFMDDDGYGHYIGSTFEVWFKIYQTDVDADYIPYWTEVNVLGTNPLKDDSMNDPDEDGIPTSWEWQWGYDPFTWDDHEHLDPDVDGIQNIEEYKMRKYFADPYRPDIYIEADGMVKGGILDKAHEFYDESAQIMIERFASHGINLYIDNGWPSDSTIGGGELLEPHIKTISQETGLMLQWYRHNFADERKGIFRYMIVGHEAGFCIPSELNHYDTIVIDSSPSRLIKRTAFTDRTQRIVLAAAAMHELGHSVGIAPWTIQGCDNISFVYGRAQKQDYIDTWADYYSVMNYYHIWDKNLADFSDGSNGPPYDQNDWAHFYLPTFEIDANAVEDPLIEPPGTDRLNNETPEPVWTDWVLEEDLTMNYSAALVRMCYIENIKESDIEIRVYVPEDYDPENKDNTTVLVYAKPDTGGTYSQWSLIAEGTLDEEGKIHFYSQEELIDNIRN